MPAPTVPPSAYIAVAKVSRSRGKRSASIEVAHGLRAASPAPTPIRHRNSCAKFSVTPQAAVASDQTVTPRKMIERRLKRSASTPAARPSSANVTMKAVPFSSANCVSVMPMSRRRGATRSERTNRSSTDIQNMKQSTAVAYQAVARGG